MLAVCCGASQLNAAGWPIFRGNPALTGVATDPLPDTLDLLWSYKTGAPVKSSAVIGGGRAFIGSNDGHVHALEMASGHEVWTFDAGAPVQAPPMLSGNAVFVGNIEGIFYSIDAGSGKTNWKFSTEGKILASANELPNPGGEPRILVGSYDFKLYCLDAGTGKSNWVYETGNYINGSCAVAGGRDCAPADCRRDAARPPPDEWRTTSRTTGAGTPIAASVASAGGTGKMRPSTTTRKRISLRGHITEGKVAWRFHESEFPFMASAAVSAGRVVFGGFDEVEVALRESG